MAVSAEVMELVGLLDEMGFSVLAGELLAEVAGPKETDGGDQEDAARVRFVQRIAAAAPTDRDQLGMAIAFLRRRLVEPARRLAEAEKIAGNLLDRGAPPVAIRFIDQGEDDVGAFDARDREPRREPRERALADELDECLSRIATS